MLSNNGRAYDFQRSAILSLILIAGLFLSGCGIQSVPQAKNELESKLAETTNEYKRRADLIPNLVETVKGYAKHEKSVFEEVTKARTAIMDAKGVKDTAHADNMFEGALKSLFAVAEAYPDLKANENYKQLQEELVDTEDKIQASRRFYNGAVRDLNTKIQVFPTNIFAGMLGFSAREFFEVEDRKSIEEPVQVKL